MTVKYSWVQLSFAIISILILGLGFFGKNTNTQGVILGILLFVALILFDIYTPKIANLSTDNPKVKTMRRLNRFSMVFTVICFSAINWLPEITKPSSKESEIFSTVIVVVIMILIGNTAPKIPFNRYMGLRLPWTIRDESTWRVAHKLLGYITFPLVIILIIGSIFGDFATFIKYCIIAWIAFPGVYSGFHYYMKLQGKR